MHPSLLLVTLIINAYTRQHEVTVTLQCSGTRRIEQIREYPGDGDELINAVSARISNVERAKGSSLTFRISHGVRVPCMCPFLFKGTFDR